MLVSLLGISKGVVIDGRNKEYELSYHSSLLQKRKQKVYGTKKSGTWVTCFSDALYHAGLLPNICFHLGLLFFVLYVSNLSKCYFSIMSLNICSLLCPFQVTHLSVPCRFIGIVQN